MGRFVVPIGGLAVVILLAFTLIGVIMVRPWAGPDKSWRTHMNLTDGPYSEYTRSVQSFVSEKGSAPIVVWRLDPEANVSPGNEEGRALFVARGCASCHGLSGQGTATGPSLLGASERKILRMIREGSGGMPAYYESDLPMAEREAIAAYIVSLGPAPTETPASGTPTATPWPSPTPPPTPTPTMEPTPEPGATLTPVPTPTPTVAPEPTLSPEEFKAAQRLFTDVGCDICHGVQAKGGEKGPALEGLTADEIRSQVRDPVRPPDSRYPRAMKAFAMDELSDEELERIIEYILSLDRSLNHD